MSMRIWAFDMTPPTRTQVLSYVSVTFVTGVTGLLVLMRAELWPAVQGSFGLYDAWMVLASALAGLSAMVVARGWFGLPGLLGGLRAFFGMLVMAIAAALIGGSLILPVYGTLQAPFIVLSAFIAQPLWAVFWCCGVFVAHAMLAQAERRLRAVRSEQEQRAQAALSPLSQAYFYRK